MYENHETLILQDMKIITFDAHVENYAEKGKLRVRFDSFMVRCIKKEKGRKNFWKRVESQVT